MNDQVTLICSRDERSPQWWRVRDLDGHLWTLGTTEAEAVRNALALAATRGLAVRVVAGGAEVARG